MKIQWNSFLWAAKVISQYFHGSTHRFTAFYSVCYNQWKYHYACFHWYFTGISYNSLGFHKFHAWGVAVSQLVLLLLLSGIWRISTFYLITQRVGHVQWPGTYQEADVDCNGRNHRIRYQSASVRWRNFATSEGIVFLLASPAQLIVYLEEMRSIMSESSVEEAATWIYGIAGLVASGEWYCQSRSEATRGSMEIASKIYCEERPSINEESVHCQSQYVWAVVHFNSMANMYVKDMERYRLAVTKTMHWVVVLSYRCCSSELIFFCPGWKIFPMRIFFFVSWVCEWVTSTFKYILCYFSVM